MLRRADAMTVTGRETAALDRRRFPHVLAERRIESQVQQSWMRCRAQLALEPSSARTARVVGAAELMRRRRDLGATLEASEVEMRSLLDLMQAPVGIMLTDREGVIVSYVGAAEFTRAAQRAGMREGAVWSEAEQGTNGMGTCLVAREPVLILRSEHFLQQNAGFVCCAAPIHGPTGDVIGVLNVSCLDELSWAPTLALVTRTAEAIAARALILASRDAVLLRFHPHRAFVTTAGEGLLSLDTNGQVIGANQAAFHWLQIAEPSKVLGHSVQTLLSLNLESLLEMARSNPWQPIPLGDSALFGLIQLPPKKKATEILSAEHLKQAERAALLEVLGAAQWNVSLAAQKLGIGRKTLHRKIAKYQIRRPGGPEAQASAVKRRRG